MQKSRPVVLANPPTSFCKQKCPILNVGSVQMIAHLDSDPHEVPHSSLQSPGPATDPAPLLKRPPPNASAFTDLGLSDSGPQSFEELGRYRITEESVQSAHPGSVAHPFASRNDRMVSYYHGLETLIADIAPEQLASLEQKSTPISGLICPAACDRRLESVHRMAQTRKSHFLAPLKSDTRRYRQVRSSAGFGWSENPLLLVCNKKGCPLGHHYGRPIDLISPKRSWGPLLTCNSEERANLPEESIRDVEGTDSIIHQTGLTRDQLPTKSQQLKRTRARLSNRRLKWREQAKCALDPRTGPTSPPETKYKDVEDQLLAQPGFDCALCSSLQRQQSSCQSHTDHLYRRHTLWQLDPAKTSYEAALTCYGIQGTVQRDIYVSLDRSCPGRWTAETLGDSLLIPDRGYDLSDPSNIRRAWIRDTDAWTARVFSKDLVTSAEAAVVSEEE